MSPEYAMEGVFSIKSDVYSFGVLMLEIVSGRKNNSFYHVDYTLNLVGNVCQLNLSFGFYLYSLLCVLLILYMIFSGMEFMGRRPRARTN